MPPIKDIGVISEKWKRVTPERSIDYQAGITSPRKDWKVATLAAKETWKAAITIAVTQDRFAKGVGKVTSDKWRDGALLKGATRFGEGVRLAENAYAAGFGPYRDIIERITLPPRYPRGDSRNIERVRVIAEALHKAKIGG